MLSIQKQPKYIQKTVALPNGTKALVVFELVETNGKVTAKAVFWKVLKQGVPQKKEVILLANYLDKCIVQPIISPFFPEVINLFKNFSFVTAQPTRAPNFV